jgi:cysteine desulfurase
MKHNPIYLDFNATTPVHPAVVEAMLPFFGPAFGNPSGAHPYGFRLRSAVETARAQLAGLIGAHEDEIVFTSCASESNNLALKGLAFAALGCRNHIVISTVEHPAVTNTARFLSQRGFSITVVPVDAYGRVDPEALREAVTERTLVVSVLHAQNEIGTVQPISRIADVAHEKGALLHTDAAQSVGKIPVDVEKLGVDLLAIAGNKFYAPKGAGALYVRRGIKLEPLIHGGGHENGFRAGTENAAFAVGLGKTAELAQQRLSLYDSHVRPLRDRLHQRILSGVPNAVLNGHPDKRLPNTLNVSFPGIGSTELQAAVRDRVACSTGCGCHEGEPTPSPTLLAIGREEGLARAALRLTLGIETTEAEIDDAASVLVSAINDEPAGANLTLNTHMDEGHPAE